MRLLLLFGLWMTLAAAATPAAVEAVQVRTRAPENRVVTVYFRVPANYNPKPDCGASWFSEEERIPRPGLTGFLSRSPDNLLQKGAFGEALKKFNKKTEKIRFLLLILFQTAL